MRVVDYSVITVPDTEFPLGFFWCLEQHVGTPLLRQYLRTRQDVMDWLALLTGEERWANTYCFGYRHIL